MDKNKQSEIETALDGIDYSLAEIRGAMKDINDFKAQIYDILNGEKGEELFELDRNRDAEEKLKEDALDIEIKHIRESECCGAEIESGFCTDCKDNAE